MLLLAAVPTRSQEQALPSLDPAKALHQFVHEIWDEDDGFPFFAIRAIRQTRGGYLWLGTQGGVARFDGVRFTLFNRANEPAFERSSFVTSLCEDRMGTLWIGTHGAGLIQYQAGRFSVALEDAELPDPRITAIRESSTGELWIGTYNGAVRIRDGELTVVSTADGLRHNHVTSLYGSPAGAVWIGTDRGGLARFQDEHLSSFDLGSDATISFFLAAITEDRDGVLWVAPSFGPLTRFDGSGFTASSEVEFGPTSPGAVLGDILLLDRAGTLWAGGQRGLFRLRDDGGFDHFDEADGLSDNRVLSIFEDREGNLWIGTYGGGLNRLKDGRVTNFSSRDGLSGSFVRAVHEDAEGGLWFGSKTGLTRLADGVYTSFGTRDGLRSELISAVFQDRSHILWIGTQDGGLHRFDEGRFIPLRGLLSDEIVALHQSSDGSLWIGTALGLNRWRETMVAYAEEQGLASTYVQVVHEDRAGTIWVGTTGGLYVLDRERDRFASFPALATTNVREIYEDADGILWFGTLGAGLYRLSGESLTAFSISQGFPDDFVWHILEDDREWLWMISDLGIFTVPKTDLRAYSADANHAIRAIHFGTREGMATAEGVGLYHPGAVRARDGALWFPTVKGAVRVNPDSIRGNHLPPPVAIERILSRGEEIDLTGSPSLSPDHRDLEIQYTGLGLRSPERLTFKVHLEGYDDGWQDVGHRRVAYYTNLPPGDYAFHVIAANEDGVWNEEAASFSFTIIPRFYERAGFIVACGLGVLFLGYLGILIRTARIRRRNLELENLLEQLDTANQKLYASNRELEQKNAELEQFTYTVSHDLKTPLVTIRGFSGALRADLTRGDRDKVESDLSRIESAAKQMSRLLDDLLELSRVGRVVNELRPTPLTEIVEEAVEGVDKRTVDGRLVEVAVAPAMPVVLADRLRLGEVFQNLVENATKFMGSQREPRIEIGADVLDDAIVCYVRDNGTGIDRAYQDRVFKLFERLDPAVEGTGIGLALVKRIVEWHGGRIWVESAGIGQGSTFYVELPKGGV